MIFSKWFSKPKEVKQPEVVESPNAIERAKKILSEADERLQQSISNRYGEIDALVKYLKLDPKIYYGEKIFWDEGSPEYYLPKLKITSIYSNTEITVWHIGTTNIRPGLGICYWITKGNKYLKRVEGLKTVDTLCVDIYYTLSEDNEKFRDKYNEEQI